MREIVGNKNPSVTWSGAFSIDPPKVKVWRPIRLTDGVWWRINQTLSLQVSFDCRRTWLALACGLRPLRPVSKKQKNPLIHVQGLTLSHLEMSIDALASIMNWLRSTGRQTWITFQFNSKSIPPNLHSKYGLMSLIPPPHLFIKIHRIKCPSPPGPASNFNEKFNQKSANHRNFTKFTQKVEFNVLNLMISFAYQNSFNQPS